jgi:hypothetical protein
MGQRPLIPQRNSWGRFKQNIAKLTIEALFILREETELARDEPTLNRTLALCFVEANLRLDLDYQPALDAKNFPHSEDEKKSISENNIPDLSWNIIDHIERCNRNFALECKRLGKPSSRTWVLNKQYIEEGLLRFFKDEEGYSKGCELGAMVGYIQNMDFEEILCEVNRHIITFEPSIPTLAAPAEGWQGQGISSLSHSFERSFTPSLFILDHYWVDIRDLSANSQDQDAEDLSEDNISKPTSARSQKRVSSKQKRKTSNEPSQLALPIDQND